MIDFNPRRIGDRIVLFLEKDNKPAPIPVEYQPFITTPAYDWDMRIITIKQICNQYSRPLFERIWFFVGLASIMVIPTLLHRVVADAVFREDRPFDTLIEARWITFGIYMATFLMFFLPITIWKSMGNRKLNMTLRGWNAQDRAAHPDAIFVPTWKVTLPGIFMIYGKLKITLPPQPQVTVFHQNAYIPPYLANTLAPPGYNYYPPTGPNPNPAVVAYGAPIPGYSTDTKGEDYDRRGYPEDIKDRV